MAKKRGAKQQKRDREAEGQTLGEAFGPPATHLE
jgi:hypothetical protein